jgi:hypothetical protein
MKCQVGAPHVGDLMKITTIWTLYETISKYDGNLDVYFNLKVWGNEWLKFSDPAHFLFFLVNG